MTFRMSDSKSENYVDIEIPNKALMEYLEDYAYEELTKCECESNGESNAIECDCEDKYTNYYLSEIF